MSTAPSRQTRLPDLIDPWQPFKSMRAITHQVAPGLLAECRMEGDTFEMEDQRNWSDASYKTYVRPLELPWPYVLPAGTPMTQSVTLRFTGGVASGAGRPTTDAVVRLRVGESGPRMPEIGVVVYPEEVEAALGRIEALKELAPQALLLHFDPTKGHGAPEMAAFAVLAAAYPASVTLECALPCERDLDDELGELAGLVSEAGLRLDAIVVSPSVDRHSTPPGSAWPDCPPLEDVYEAARRAFPGVRLGGGMLSYFTELNRKRVPADDLAFVTHCTSPIVHAADDESVMQSLEALPFITRSVRAIYGDKPYRIGPSTIAMRQNPYGSATKDNPKLSRIAMADRDPRHNALFGAAWAVGYAARTAPAGLEQLVLSAFAGPFGVLAGSGEPVARRRLEAARPRGEGVGGHGCHADAQRRDGRQRARRPGRRLGGRQDPRLDRQSDRQTPRRGRIGSCAAWRRGRGPEFRNPCWRRVAGRRDRRRQARTAGLRRGAPFLGHPPAVSSRRRHRARASAPNASPSRARRPPGHARRCAR